MASAETIERQRLDRIYGVETVLLLVVFLFTLVIEKALSAGLTPVSGALIEVQGNPDPIVSSMIVLADVTLWVPALYSIALIATAVTFLLGGAKALRAHQTDVRSTHEVHNRVWGYVILIGEGALLYAAAHFLEGGLATLSIITVFILFLLDVMWLRRDHVFRRLDDFAQASMGRGAASAIEPGALWLALNGSTVRGLASVILGLLAMWAVEWKSTLELMPLALLIVAILLLGRCVTDVETNMDFYFGRDGT